MQTKTEQPSTAKQYCVAEHYCVKNLDKGLDESLTDDQTACIYCGHAEQISIAEVWSDHHFQLDTCCEHLHDEFSQRLAADPKQAAALLRRLDLEGLANLRARRVVDNGSGTLVLDWQIAIDSAIPQKQARAFVTEHHRHCPAPVGWKFGAGIRNGQTLIGVIMVGRPVARMIDSKRVLEVNRLCNRTDIPNALVWNACSMAYGWAAREAKKRGFEIIITYTLEHECGASLKAAGWVVEHCTKGRSWSTPGRTRDDKTPTVNKLRWTPASMAEISVSINHQLNKGQKMSRSESLTSRMENQNQGQGLKERVHRFSHRISAPAPRMSQASSTSST